MDRYVFTASAMASTLAPINIISEIAIPISLSLRLFANVLSGTVIMALVYGLLGVIATAWPAALHVYFDLFSGAIQTYVFCMLTMTYVSQACEKIEMHPQDAFPTQIASA